MSSSDNQSPEKKNRKRGRLRKLNDLRDMGSKGQRLSSGDKKNLGISDSGEHAQEYLEPQSEIDTLSLNKADHTLDTGLRRNFCWILFRGICLVVSFAVKIRFLSAEN